MGLFANLSLATMDDLLLVELKDLYDAETRLTKALPKMAEAASSAKLKKAFKDHLHETENHVARLEEAFQALGLTPSRETCEAMKGLIAEGDEIISAEGEDSIRDAALIAAAQRVEHYEIAAYGSAHLRRATRPVRGRQALAADSQGRKGRRRKADANCRSVSKQGRSSPLTSLARFGDSPGWHWLCQCGTNGPRRRLGCPVIAKSHLAGGRADPRRHGGRRGSPRLPCFGPP